MVWRKDSVRRCSNSSRQLLSTKFLVRLFASKGAFEAGLLTSTLLYGVNNARLSLSQGSSEPGERLCLWVSHPDDRNVSERLHFRDEIEGETARRLSPTHGRSSARWGGATAVGTLAAAVTVFNPTLIRARRHSRGVLLQYASFSPLVSASHDSCSQSGTCATEAEGDRKPRKWVAHVSAAYLERQRIILTLLVLTCLAGFCLYFVYLRQVVPLGYGISLSLLVVFFGMLYEPKSGRHSPPRFSLLLPPYPGCEGLLWGAATTSRRNPCGLLSSPKAEPKSLPQYEKRSPCLSRRLSSLGAREQNFQAQVLEGMLPRQRHLRHRNPGHRRNRHLGPRASLRTAQPCGCTQTCQCRLCDREVVIVAKWAPRASTFPLGSQD